MVTRITSFALQGVDAYPVTVEVDVQPGLPCFEVVGLPDAAVRESRERVRAAIRNSGLDFPPRRITVNLAPADTRKNGPGFDLPIALAVLAATDQLKPAGDGAPELAGLGIVGELSLDGGVRSVPGALAMAQAARNMGLGGLLVAAPDAAEAALARSGNIYPAATLADVAAWLRGMGQLAPMPPPTLEVAGAPAQYQEDMADVAGQPVARRALEVAAAGGHNLLLMGPPGAGKSMLARRLPGILPPLTWEEAVEVTRIYSAAGQRSAGGLVNRRPFRQPHHSATRAALIGTPHRPGELSLAHHGVLFIDELPECSREFLESMRQPLEDGQVAIARAQAAVVYPAQVMLVAAANPCPCGEFGGSEGACSCAPWAVQRYAARLSGPIIDRFDLHVRLGRVAYADVRAGRRGESESSALVAARVAAARERQRERLAGIPGIWCNGRMASGLVRRFCAVDYQGEALLARACDRMGLSLRGHDRVLKVARTIADLAGSEEISVQHLAEALQYRGALTPATGATALGAGR